MSYFLAPPAEQAQPTTDLATDLNAVADRIRKLMAEARLGIAEYEAMKLLELTVRQGAQLASAIGERPARPSRRPRLRALPRAAKRAS